MAIGITLQEELAASRVESNSHPANNRHQPRGSRALRHHLTKQWPPIRGKQPMRLMPDSEQTT